MAVAQWLLIVALILVFPTIALAWPDSATSYLRVGVHATFVSTTGRRGVRQRLGLRLSSDARNTDDAPAATEEIKERVLPPSSILAGVIFDMDGTLTRHSIDFPDMRRRIYEIADADLGPQGHSGGCVLALSERLSSEGKAAAKAVFVDIEAKSTRDMKFNDGAGELCRYLDSQGVRRAVLTRNVERSVDAMHHMLMEREGVPPFFPAVARDTRLAGEVDALPSKPAPDAILHICSLWGCNPFEVIFVGDSAADDIVAANRAGCGGKVLLASGGNLEDTDCGSGGPQDEDEERERIPSLTVKSLLELLEVLEKQ